MWNNLRLDSLIEAFPSTSGSTWVSPSTTEVARVSSDREDSSRDAATDVKSSEYDTSDSLRLDLDDLRLSMGDLLLEVDILRALDGDDGADDLRSSDCDLRRRALRTDDMETSESLTARVVSESLGSELSLYVITVAADRVVSSSGISAAERPVDIGLGDRDLTIVMSSISRTLERLDFRVIDRGVSESIERSGGTVGIGE